MGILTLLPEGAHTRRRGQKVTKSKDDKRQLNELLGMSPSAADRKLRKAVMHELARQLGKNVCLDCGLEISEPDDLAVVHVEDWRDGPSFFDLANVAFSHASCRAGRHDRRQGEREMRRVEVTVEDSRGRALRGCMHQGQLYVAGNKDQRYQVRVKNRTGKRLCLVVTVDGRNVNTGKKGSWDGSGFVLEAHQEWVFKGWRQSNDSVAAFRLGAKEDAYSSQMGTSENVGVIGVAVFEEKEPERPVITVKETQYVPVPYPVPAPREPWPYPRNPWITWHTIADKNTGHGLEFDNNVRYGGVVPTSTTISSASAGIGSVNCSTEPSSSDGSSVEFSTASMTMDSVEMERPRGGKRRKQVRRRRAGGQSAHQQQLGTEYGETLSSQVRDTAFERDTDEPVELHLIRYDSVVALEKAGIMTGRPSARPKKPQAFPESPEVEKGFCAPPRRRRFV